MLNEGLYFGAGASASAGTRLAIETAFEAAGIEFIDETGGGEGLRFRNRH
jgi:hypothetical protein